MQTLGEIITRLDDGGQVAEILTGLDNPALLQKLEQCSQSVGRQPGEVAMAAVRAFSAAADDDAWLKLLGRVQDAHSPAAVCLAEMLAWSLKE